MGGASGPMQVPMTMPVTTHGPMFEDGRRPPRYPQSPASVVRGMRTLQPRFAKPAQIIAPG